MRRDSRFKIQDLRFQSGFTLIELLIVVVIIGVLSSLLTANFITVRQRARDAQRKADLRQMQSALELYRADQGAYKVQAGSPYQLNTVDCPTSSAFTNQLGTVTYLQKIPCEPLGTSAYNGGDYAYSSDGTTYTLAACLENTGDTSGVTAVGFPNAESCPSSWLYVVRNP